MTKKMPHSKLLGGHFRDIANYLLGGDPNNCCCCGSLYGQHIATVGIVSTTQNMARRPRAR